MKNRMSAKFGVCVMVLQVLGLFGANFAGARENGPPPLSRSEQQALYDAGQAMENKHYESAAKLLKEVIDRRQDKTDYRLFFQLGNIGALRELPEKALSAYEQAISKYARDPAVWQNMGKACFDLERYSEAADHMERAFELQENKSPELLYQAAGCRMMAGEAQDAYFLLRDLCSGEDASIRSEWLESLAYACLELGKDREAMQSVERLLSRDADDPRWWKMLANLHIRKEAYDQAAAALKIHNQLAPGKKEDVIRLGDLYQAAGVPAKAAAQYELALQWTQTSRHYEKIARAYLNAHQAEKAVAVLSQGLKRKPTARLWQMMGTILYNQDKPDDAYLAFQKSHGLDPRQGRVALMIGYSALKSGRHQDAIAAFEKAAAYKSQKKAARRALKSVRRMSRRQARSGWGG